MIYKNNIIKKKSITLRIRNLIITQSLFNKKINIVNGQGYFSKIINKSDLGHKLGEYAFTKSINSDLHIKKKIKKKINKKK